MTEEEFAVLKEDVAAAEEVRTRPPPPTVCSFAVMEGRGNEDGNGKDKDEYDVDMDEMVALADNPWGLL